MTSTEFKGPIVEGAWYERKDGSVGRCWSFNTGFGHVLDDPYHQDSGERVYADTPRLTRRVYITHADPAEVVAELQARSSNASMRSYSAGYPEASAHESALAQAYEFAADLVAEKLGVK